MTIGDILENGRNSNAEDNLSIYGDEPLIDDMFVTAARVQVSISTTHVYGEDTKKFDRLLILSMIELSCFLYSYHKNDC